MSVFVNVNGRIADGAHASISVFDHGFLYGEGVYEDARTYNGEPFLFDRHMQRLRASAAMILLDVPVLRSGVPAALARNDGGRRAWARSDDSFAEAYIRILLTRGIGDLTYDPAATPHPRSSSSSSRCRSRRRSITERASRSAWWTSSAITRAR